jgi:hypothetical protein
MPDHTVSTTRSSILAGYKNMKIQRHDNLLAQQPPSNYDIIQDDEDGEVIVRKETVRYNERPGYKNSEVIELPPREVTRYIDDDPTFKSKN